MTAPSAAPPPEAAPRGAIWEDAPDEDELRATAKKVAGDVVVSEEESSVACSAAVGRFVARRRDRRWEDAALGLEGLHGSSSSRVRHPDSSTAIMLVNKGVVAM